MTPAAVLFMAGSWLLVLGLTFWSFRRVLRASRRPGAADVPKASGDGHPEGGDGA